MMRSAWSAVSALSGIVAAVASSMSSGIGTTQLASIATSSEYAPMTPLVAGQ
jgi:hypothetical protein